VAERLVSVLKRAGFDRADRRDRVMIQSFYKEALVRVKQLHPLYARVQLLPAEGAGDPQPTLDSDLAKSIAEYASGVGPNKNLLKRPEDVAVFHRAGLFVHPYTFRGQTTAQSRIPLGRIESNGQTARQNIVDEIYRFIEMGIDGGFTDYPELWKDAARRKNK
jgi:glycerophosphoryl diester phosphodiesterase